MNETAKWPDLAGRLCYEDGEPYHALGIRVYFEDTDFSGLVYHASYVRWCERGRSDFLRLLGNDHRGLISGGVGNEPAAFVVRRMSFDFRRPARIDDVLEVETRTKEIGAAHLLLDQRVTRDGNVIVSADVMVVLVAISGKPLRLTSTIRAAFSHRNGG